MVVCVFFLLILKFTTLAKRVSQLSSLPISLPHIFFFYGLNFFLNSVVKSLGSADVLVLLSYVNLSFVVSEFVARMI